MIRVDQPRRWDLVGNKILLAGIGTGFEATFNYRIGDGHDEVSSWIMAGGGSGENAQFQVEVDVHDMEFRSDRLFVEVYEASAKDGSDLHKVTRSVLLGPRMCEGYYGFREHTIKPGETLTQIAQHHYGTDDYYPILRANPETDPYLWDWDPDLIKHGDVLRIPVGV